MSFFSKIVENNKGLAIGLGVATAVAVGVGMYKIFNKVYTKIINKKRVKSKDWI